jgi:hypothetical protein
MENNAQIDGSFTAHQQFWWNIAVAFYHKAAKAMIRMYFWAFFFFFFYKYF